MILGIGTDIVTIDRVRRMLDRHGDAFCERHFTPGEREYCDAGKGHARAERYAARFAAKEAMSKALGCGIGADAGFHDMDVQRTSDDTGLTTGPPRMVLSGDAKATADRLGVVRVHLSIAHEKDHAIAFVIVEGD